MRCNQLNLPALCARRLPKPRPDISAPDLFDPLRSLTMTRRGLLGWAVSAAVAVPLGFAADPPPFQLVAGNKRVVFRTGGSDKWVIDTRSFAGSPQLSTTQHKDAIRIELKDARYPGTEIPADFISDLTRRAEGWQMHLQLEWGGFESGTPFVSWLEGDVPARSRFGMNSRICDLGSSAGVLVTGQAQADFFPDWRIQLCGHEVAKLFGVGGGAASDSLVVSLLAPGEVSILTHPPERRTLLAMQRRELAWPLRPDLGQQQSWDLIASDGSFDLMHIETGESSSGEPCRALLAESRGEGPSFWFVPGEHLRGDNSSAQRVGLRNARYVMTFDGGRGESSFIADYVSDPVRLDPDGFSPKRGDSAGAARFELTMSRGEVTQLRCTPPIQIKSREA
ncbi:MAG: hypothetical protein P4N24_18010 [Acidobacteriota bacterium]|nr:hypothetical protein [Acidobacteriota bacterium]